MRPHPRIRKAIKWGGLSLGILLTITCTWCATQSLGVARVGGRHWLSARLAHGNLIGHVAVDPDAVEGAKPVYVWTKRRIANPMVAWRPSVISNADRTIVLVPLWIPSLASLMLSGFAWRLDTLATRRARRGICPKCSYPRTGLAPSSPCPECGAAAPQA